MSDVLVDAHGVGWAKMRLKHLGGQGFFKNIELLLRPFEAGAQDAHLWVAGYFYAAHLSHGLVLLPAVQQLGLVPNCCAAACVLRLSTARRRASARKA